MILPDVNVLVYAHREECERHIEYRRWLEELWAAPSTFGISDLVLSSCLRILTHPRVFAMPTPVELALRYVNQIRQQSNCIVISPGARHWTIFSNLCHKTRARGNLVTDAYLAALAIESGAEWVTTDRDFARFPGLNWRHPLDR